LQLPVYFDQLKLADARLFATVTPGRKLLEREHIGGFRLWLNPTTGSSEGIDAAHSVTDSIAHGRLPADFLADLGAMLADIDVLADAAYKTIFRTNMGWIRPAKNAPNSGAWVDLNFEQRPNRDSRVLLGNDRDRLGQRRVQLDWRLSETDRKTATRALDVAAQEFGRIGLGRARIALDLSHDASWPANMISSCHHSGTARMSNDPRTGVVDADCRVHSIDNLYVAGSAVFPTAGYANPTLTIVALAQRLAEHLERTLT
jgi:choline dehydrogenase-like flavoprotein